MAVSLRFRVYNSEGEYLAIFRHVEDAAILVAAKEDGTTIRMCMMNEEPDLLWTKGLDGSAVANHSHVAIIVDVRIRQKEARS